MKKLIKLKKPVVLEAIQWDGNNLEEIEEFTGFDAFVHCPNMKEV